MRSVPECSVGRCKIVKSDLRKIACLYQQKCHSGIVPFIYTCFSSKSPSSAQSSVPHLHHL